MSLEDLIFIKLILGITLRQQLLGSLAIVDPFLSRTNLPPVLQVSN